MKLAGHTKQTRLARGDAWWWRLPATGFCFVTFGTIALLAGSILVSMLRLVHLGRRVPAAQGRAIVCRLLRAFVAMMRGLGVLTYEFEGVERLGRPGQLIVANHPTLIDVVFLMAFTPRANCVVKEALWQNPFIRQMLIAAGYISNAPSDTMIRAAADALRAGQSLILFPEGTRTSPGETPQFGRGAAAVALKAAVALTPVHIKCAPPTLARQAPWYRIPARRPHFTLRVGDDIDLEAYRRLGPASIASRALNTDLIRRFADHNCTVGGQQDDGFTYCR